jgi:hypothetical protein
MAKNKHYADSDDSGEAWRARMTEQETRWAAGADSDPRLAKLIERDAVSAMARAIAKHGRD